MAITVGSVEVDIIPNTQGIYARLRAGLVPAATRAGDDAGQAAGRAFGPAMSGAVSNTVATQIGHHIGHLIGQQIAAQVSDSLSHGITIGGQQAQGAAARQGQDAGGAFARTLRAKLVEAFRSMPRLDVSLNDTGVDAELARLRARMETLSNKRIGVDVDVAAADAEVADISERLQRLGAAHPNVAVRTDTAAARAALAAIRAEIERVTARPGVVRLETDGSFGVRLRAAVRAAEAALPNINIGADTGPAQAELASLRAQLTTLRDQRVGIDIDATTASARIDEIRARLRVLGASAADIAVRVDAATAEAQLAQVAAMADALDGKDIDLHVSNTQAMSAIFQVSVAIAALTALPAIPILAAGTGSLVAGFTAAGVGVGAFAAAALPALSSIKGALDAQKQAQTAASTATAKGGQTAAQTASKSLQLAGAQQALASAQRNGARQIQQAEQAVGDAVLRSAQANTQAAAQVKQARQAVAVAVEQAAQRQQQADRAVIAAEKSLTQAQVGAKQAQLDLVAARKTATDQLLDLNNQLKDSQLSQRDAAYQAQEAQLSLNQTLADPKATKLQKAEAQLAYEQAIQHLAEQQLATKRLSDQTAAANKAGVTGSATYKAAQDQVAQAQQNITDKTQALKDAQAAQAKTEVDNARTITDAQAKLADAQKNVAVIQAQGARAVADAQERVVEAQQSAADSITSAQRQIQSASLSASKGVDASATAANKYQQALAKLTPSARGTFNALIGLRAAFKDWSRDLQPEIMPIFTRGIDGAKNSLPGLTPLVIGAARGIGTLQDKISRGFKSPWWQTLKKDFQASVEPAIVGVGTAIGNTFVGAAGIVDAFLPHITSISSRMDRITGRFARFGKNLRGSPEFESFLSYSAQEAPKLADALGKIGRALLDTAKAVSPLSGPVLALLGALATAISAVAVNTPGLVQILYGLFVVTRLVTLAQIAMTGAMLVYRAGVVLAILLTEGWTAAIIAANLAFEANPIVAVVTIVIAALALLVIGILYAWNHFAWFRTAVLGVWHAILTSVSMVVSWFTRTFIPFFTRTIPGAFAWLLNWVRAHWPLILGILTGPIGLAVYAILHYWGDIESGFSNGWNWIRRNVFNPMGAFFTRTIPGWAGTLKDKVIGAFDDAATGIGRMWAKIEDLTKKPVNFVLNTVWNKGIVGVWDKIGGWIPGLPKLHKLPLLAQGGTLPVRPGVFNRPTAIVGEGNPAHPEYVIPTDPRYRTRAVGLLQQAGTQMLSGGGIIGTITGTAKDVGGAIADAGKGAWKGITSAADFLANPAGNLLKLLTPWLDKLKPLTGTGWGAMAASLPKLAVEGLKGLVGLGGDAGGGDSGAHGGGPAAAQAIARRLLPGFGWGQDQMAPLIKLWNGESGWNYKALNASSGAYGIPQALPASKMASAGADWRTNPATQIKWGMDYIKGRPDYGSPSAAWAKWLSRTPHWYDDGGYLAPGLNLAYNGTGRPEPVFTAAQANALTGLAASPGHAGRGGGDVNVYYNAPTPENPQKAAMELGRRALAAVTT